MNQKSVLNKVLDRVSFLFNTRAAGLYILLFAAAIGIATFVENDFGTSSAQKVIFKARWFELLLVLFCITLVVNIIKFRMIQNKKWAQFLFHLSMIIIILGAAITRYYSFEGMMHIRENDQSNTFLSADTYLNFEVLQGGQKYRFEEHVLFATLGNNHFEESYQVGADLIKVEVKDFIPNPVQKLSYEEGNPATLKIVKGTSEGRQEYFISLGETRTIHDQKFNFTNSYEPGSINLYFRNDSLMIQHDRPLSQMIMATQEKSELLPRSNPYPLFLRSLYSDGSNSFVFGDFSESGKVILESESPKVKNESLTALEIEVSINDNTETRYLYGKKGMQGKAIFVRHDNTSLAISYGSKVISLPFYVKLYDFIMERYPGTNSAASYASEVQLIDPRNNHAEDFRIYMNHILDYDGYRFFQSSFDKDEQGTYLSVNHDFYGTWVSYIGYILLTVGLIMVFFSKNTRFYELIQKINRIRDRSTSVVLLLVFSAFLHVVQAQKAITPDFTSVSQDHAELWSQLSVQDHKGRMKPLHTLDRELMRKISRKESYNGLNADQVILSMFANKQEWLGIPLIKLSKEGPIRSKLGIETDLASYKDFFLPSGEYKLREDVRRAYGLQPIDRAQYDKDLMKIDERINIMSMIFSGSIFKVIPMENDENNTWISDAFQNRQTNSSDFLIAQKFFSSYKEALSTAVKTGDYMLPNKILTELSEYQRTTGADVIPTDSKISAEIFLNNFNIFNRLSAYYSLLGLCFLIALFFSVFNSTYKLNRIQNILVGLVILGFTAHTLGLGLRWYVSGRAPWSNGYESLIYIAWTSSLAGIIFTRKSLGGMAATMILAGTILLVAMLSYLDPEITPLVPVLKSYWLTIHVSLIAGSYGFLMLGAIIGMINLILLIFQTESNKKLLTSKVRELTYISELTITGGLIMISIGTYLGGVWANESWGRYWGWDAKETWALVTILVYAFILHMRFIPKLAGIFTFNLATLFGFASVVMTYFGVNYYLSGLHSYAAGDPVPIPNWVYISVISVTIISIISFVRNRKLS